MPLSERACRACGHELEGPVFSGDEVCGPRCEGKELEKQWNVPAPAPRRR
jgi:hypothetical protein